ncbi:hypothetical protein NQ315_015012 [Exocentrus adspersus]|uniref:Ras guanine nucleotide exchange factor n=1 Tax=Exocentrus adspersus TaxID=1586481 RepID=A0AAV8VWD7_9CUCU|nr:hypothetical protein NQ315_015012 [Exocentrus adspersus]
MLSPKMQRTIRINENQLIMLSERAHFDHSQAGYLHKRSADSNKWQLRWFVLYQNLLFYYDSENSHRPSGIVLLEGCYCERLITTGSASKSKDGSDRQFCFAISYRKENIRQYELRALNEMDCKSWIEAIREASFNKLLLQKEELEQKHLHLLQIVESEKTAKWQYTQQCEELASEIKKLRAELFALKKEWKPVSQHQSTGSLASTQGSCSSGMSGQFSNLDQDSIELRKIKKVQSFFRGWLCRRRWKQIVEQYIKSPHAESMRKRNSLVFRMVEAEEEYMEQMEVLVTCFLRPFKMAASSKKPPCSHEDVNSIFLNSETVLFLHQIFLKGLTSRLESWPTLVLGDLFSMLLPMLSIYQEYVRNHHYSLQVLTECKQSAQFSAMLKRLESKSACRGRSLEAFLTYPMHQVPRYIITLHELLAHTPHDHVERKSLQNARQQLEDLSRQMHDEVSETENLRKNLALERMIVEGCDILLDVNQVFVRQGTLIQLPSDKPRTPRSKLTFKTEKEAVRQCFLFSNHLIIATRTSSGKLHLVPDIGKIPLADSLLIEDPSEHPEDDGSSFIIILCIYIKYNNVIESSICSVSSQSTTSESSTPCNFHNRDFKIVVELKDINQPGQVCVHLVAPSIQEKAAWISDIIQCLDNAQFNDIIRPTPTDSSSISLPQTLKNDPKLFKDEADIRFSRTLNSCKVPQIRYATPERLLQRLTDEEESQDVVQPKIIRHSPTHSKVGETLAPPTSKGVSIRVDPAKDTDTEPSQHLTIPKVAASSSSETLTDATVLSAPCSPSNVSSVTLVGSSASDNGDNKETTASPVKSPTKSSVKISSPTKEQTQTVTVQRKPSVVLKQDTFETAKSVQRGVSVESEDQSEEYVYRETHRASCSSSRSTSLSTTGILQYFLQSYYSSRRSIQDGDSSTARSSFQHDSPQKPSRAGVVITSFRQSKRRSSTSSAAAAFAIATSGSSNPRDTSPGTDMHDDYQAERNRHKESVMSTACTMRVLNVLRHWISKQSQDFDNDHQLKNLTIEFLEDIIYSPNLLPAEHKAAAQLLRLLTKEEADNKKIDIQKFLQPPAVSTKEGIESLSALEIAEQLTYIDHQIFISISSEEFLGQAWMKPDKEIKASHILMMTKRFNDISHLVASEILRRRNITDRVAAIEKWTAVADIARCLHNFNGVLEICSAFTNTSIFRLKKTWEKVSKTTKCTIEKLQNIVTSDGRFRSLRDALHRCDPPCIPYLGIYLTDLSFIEEGTPTFTTDGLLNFSKMRMIAHVIREIRHFQQTPYKIELIQRVANYLLDTSLIMDDDELYRTSLELEPRTSRLVSQSSITTLKS